jgi:formylglycine-generating enzyme required for sulfatase activity
MHVSKTVVVCSVVVAICLGDISAETRPTGKKATPVNLPESTNSIGMKFKLIPAGEFTTRRSTGGYEVTLTKPFKLGVHEVTQAQYEQVLGKNPSQFKAADNPVELVSWGEAVTFCRKLSAFPAEKAAGNVYRLPTEAQWEYACRAGTATRFSFGDDESDFGEYGWCIENSGRTTHPVGSKKPNAWGLYDMHGNVWEWCQDWARRYPDREPTDPKGPARGSYRVGRGGGWGDPAVSCRSATRGRNKPLHRISGYGFRVSLSPSGQ